MIYGMKAYLKDLEKRGIKIWADENDICFKAPSGSMNEEIKNQIREMKDELLLYLKEVQRIKDYEILENCEVIKAMVEIIPKVNSEESYLPTKENVQKTVKRYIKSNYKKINNPELSEWVNCANNVAIYDMFKTFYKNGIFIDDSFYTIDGILLKMDVDDSYRNFIVKWIDVLIQKKIIKKTELGYQIYNQNVISNIGEDYWNKFYELERRVNYGHDFFNYMKQCSNYLSDILQEKVKTVELLFPEGSPDNAVGVYRNNKGSIIFNEIVSDVVLSYINSKNKGKAIKILEIGAGIGGTTKLVVDNIRGENYEYYYTDISHYFLNQAEENYSNDKIKFRIFDINKPFYEQKLKAGTFDIVICANMLHNAKNGNKTIRMINHLIKDDGIFIIIDETEEPEFLLTSIELNDALSNFEDARKFSNGIFFTYEQWMDMFKQNDANIWVDFPNQNESLGETGQRLFVGNFKNSYISDNEIIKAELSNNQRIDEVVIVDDLAKNKVRHNDQTNFMHESLDNNLYKMREIWIEILNLDEIKDDDNFFEIGGDSLVITQLISRIWREYPETKKWEWKEFADIIFQNPTLKSLSYKISELESNENNINNSLIEISLVDLNIRKTDKREIYILFHDGTGELTIYNSLIQNFWNKNNEESFLYGFRYKDLNQYNPSLFYNNLAKQYAKIIEDKFGNNEIRLIGHCVGGLIALETAKILQQDFGKQTEEVTMISSYLNKNYVINKEKNNFIDNCVDSDFLMSIIFNELIKNEDTGFAVTRELVEDLLDEIKENNNGKYNDTLMNFSNKTEMKNLFRKYEKNQLIDSKYNMNFEIFKKHFKSAAEYIPPEYNGNVCIFHCNEKTKNFFIEGESEFNDSINLWSNFIRGNIRYYNIAGHHLNCLNEEYISKIIHLIG